MYFDIKRTHDVCAWVILPIDLYPFVPTFEAKNFHAPPPFSKKNHRSICFVMIAEPKRPRAPARFRIFNNVKIVYRLGYLKSALLLNFFPAQNLNFASPPHTLISHKKFLPQRKNCQKKNLIDYIYK